MTDLDLPSVASGGELVVIRRFLDLGEALTAAASLEGAGLVPRVLDAHAAGMVWLYLPALGGARLEVPVDQRFDAEELLQATVEEPLDPEELAFSAARHKERRARGLWAILFMLVPGLAFPGLLMALVGLPPSIRRRD